MHRFIRNLITEWRRLELPFNGERVIVAVSGGADSTALLLALAELRDRKKLKQEFVIAHFHHNLRGKESDGDERFVEKMAAKNDFEFVSGRGNLISRSDLEQRARHERYSFLIRTAQNENARSVLTAHTLNDQAETFLLNLIRGSGFDGLRAMPAKRKLGRNVELVRPLLNWATRQDTELYCRERKVKFRRDRMNEDLNFTRVRIRKEILPNLAELNPKIVETLARTAKLFASSPDNGDQDLIETFVDELKLSDLRKLDENQLNSHIRRWLRGCRGSLRGITLKHIEAGARLVNSPKRGRIVELPGGEQVVKGGGRLAFRHIKLEY